MVVSLINYFINQPNPQKINLKVEFGDETEEIKWNKRQCLDAIEEFIYVCEEQSMSGIVKCDICPSFLIAELFGIIKYSEGKEISEEILHNKLQLVYSKEHMGFKFDFGVIKFLYPSFSGTKISLKYFIKFHNPEYEIQKIIGLWRSVNIYYGPLEEAVKICLDVGLEEFLHIKFIVYNPLVRSDDFIKGELIFSLVRVKLIEIDLTLVRKEILGDGNILSQTNLGSKQILDGPAYNGDVLKFEFDLAPYSSLGMCSLDSINNIFSIKYYISVILKDIEGRKYYKQIPINILPIKNECVFENLPNIKIGLKQI